MIEIEATFIAQNYLDYLNKEFQLGSKDSRSFFSQLLSMLLGLIKELYRHPSRMSDQVTRQLSPLNIEEVLGNNHGWGFKLDHTLGKSFLRYLDERPTALVIDKQTHCLYHLTASSSLPAIMDDYANYCKSQQPNFDWASFAKTQIGGRWIYISDICPICNSYIESIYSKLGLHNYPSDTDEFRYSSTYSGVCPSCNLGLSMLVKTSEHGVNRGKWGFGCDDYSVSKAQSIITDAEIEKVNLKLKRYKHAYSSWLDFLQTKTDQDIIYWYPSETGKKDLLITVRNHIYVIRSFCLEPLSIK